MRQLYRAVVHFLVVLPEGVQSLHDIVQELRRLNDYLWSLGLQRQYELDKQELLNSSNLELVNTTPIEPLDRDTLDK